MVPPLQEAAEVLAAAFLAVALAEHFPQRVAVADEWQTARAQDAADTLADGVAEVQVQDAVVAVVLVERAYTRQIGAAEDHQVALQGIHLDRLARGRVRDLV